MGADRPVDRGEAAAAALAALAEHVAAGDRIDVLLDRTCTLLVNVLPVVVASITLLSEDMKAVVVAASPGDEPRLATFRQFEHGDGPGIEAIRAGQPIAEADVQERAGGRWPRWVADGFGPKIGALGAVPVRRGDRIAGLLSLGWDEPGQPDEDEVELATHVSTVVISHALVLGEADAAHVLVDQLEHALQSRVVVEQAKGVLAERLGVEIAEAYRLLRFHARSRRTRVHVIAEQVVTGELSIGRED